MSERFMSGEGLEGQQLRLRYGPRQRAIIDGESIHIPVGKITALIGPNGSGKSTLLKALARQLPTETGGVLMDGRDIAMLSPREFAQRLGILFQEHAAPGDLTVEELLYHGRHPHRRTFESLLPDDDEAVLLALQMAGLEEMRHRPLIELSGGERQLAWIAMLLAQSPNYLLLDEPTTFLDLAHQFDVMDLVLRLNRTLGKTVIMVVHDVNLAARYADYVFALRDGKIAAFGSPREVLSTETLRRVFDIEAQIVCDGDGGRIHCIPIKRAVRQ